MQIDPFLFDATREVKSLSDAFLKQNGLNYFQYATVMNDDSHYFLVTHPDFIKNRWNQKRRVLSHIEPQQINDQTFMFLWNESLPKKDTDIAREHGI